MYRGTGGDAFRGTAPDGSKNILFAGFSAQDYDNDRCRPCIYDGTRESNFFRYMSLQPEILSAAAVQFGKTVRETNKVATVQRFGYEIDAGFGKAVNQLAIEACCDCVFGIFLILENDASYRFFSPAFGGVRKPSTKQKRSCC